MKFRLFCLLKSFLVILINLSTLGITHSQTTCIDSSLINPDLLCTTEFLPVCGCDGQTYGNSCEAIKQGVLQWTFGACPVSQSCAGLSIDYLYSPIADGKTLNFTDVSHMQDGQITAWNWDFSDGTFSAEQSPSHQFAAEGQYLVCLLVSAQNNDGSTCQKNICKLINVPVECPDNCFYKIAVDVNGADFRASLTPVLQDTPFFFYVTWSLDDGLFTGTGLEFNHLIAEPGKHKICATYPTGDFSPETCTVCKVFEVSNLCVDPAQIDSGICPLVFIPVCGCDGNTYGNSCEAVRWGGVTSWRPGVCGSVCNNMALDFEGFNSGGSLTVWTFNDQTSFPGGQVTSWNWNFSNGQTSNEQNPTINFDTPGTYEVCLYASGQYNDGTQCGGSFCSTITIPEHLCLDPNVIDTSLFCPAIYAPVCGCDGNTYENECVAYYYHGITQWTKGICPVACINPQWVDTIVGCIEIFDPVCGCDGKTYANECFAQRNGLVAWKKGACCSEQNCQAAFSVELAPNGVVKVTNLSTNAHSLELDFGDGSQLIGIFDSITYFYTSNGTYQICMSISDFLGFCNDETCTTVQIESVGVADLNHQIGLSVKPNPSSTLFQISTATAHIERLQLLDIYGKIMLQQTVNDFSSRVMIDHLPKGIYLLQVDTEKGRATQKVLIH